MKADTNHNAEVIETTLLRGKIRLLQQKAGFHASLDTVFLAAAVPLKDRWNVLDIGCGVGSAGLCTASRNKNISLTGIDIQPDLIDLAHQNATLNQIHDMCRFFNVNILNDKTITSNCFNAILMNPPYQEAGTHTASPLKNKALSHGEEASGATLKDWVKYAHAKLKQGGYLTMVHRADRLDDIISTLTARRWFGSLVILPLHSRQGDDAKRVIIQARKERYRPITLKSGFIIHKKDGSYTPEARTVLEDGAAIEML
jgi:tRNA1(Val) A37 N6-methylase TrmN6